MNGKENLENREHSTAEKSKKVDVDDVVGKAEIQSAASEISSEAMKTIEGAESADEADEGFSENKGNKKDDTAGGSAQASDDDEAQNLFAYVQKTVSTKQMQREVAAAIRKEIRAEEQKVLLAYVGLKKYPPHRLAEKIAKIRSLKDLLGSLLDATKDFLTGLYLKWVRRET
ncbi:MAG: hypothetical protein V2A63_04050 [Patescibacteria group bacterium]